jgi:hypothetical protein
MRKPMKRILVVLALAGAAASVIGCAAGKPPETEVTASDFDLQPLVGEWHGDYTNPGAGRSGTIAFRLRAGESSATGKVVLIPGKADTLVAAAIVARSVINISFMRKEGNKVTGTLDPYIDPTCACRVTTNFEGSFKDARTIEGTFTTVPSQSGAQITGGKWKVIRVKRL